MPDFSPVILPSQVKTLSELKPTTIAKRAEGRAKMRVITPGFFSPFALVMAALTMASQAHAGQISSRYTSLDLNACKLVASNPDEGGWAEWSCKGHNGMAVRVAEGDLRFFVSFGPNAEKQTAASQTLSPRPDALNILQNAW